MALIERSSFGFAPTLEFLLKSNAVAGRGEHVSNVKVGKSVVVKITPAYRHAGCDIPHPGLGSYVSESGFARFPEGIAVEVVSAKIIGDVEVHIPVLVVVLPAGGIRELAVAGMQTRFLGHIAEAQASFVPQ